jgi:predicted transposase YdaD
LVLLIPPAVKKLKEQGRAKGRVEGRLEGRAEERAEWEAWLMRRNEAEANNRPFDEPPPSQRQ